MTYLVVSLGASVFHERLEILQRAAIVPRVVLVGHYALVAFSSGSCVIIRLSRSSTVTLSIAASRHYVFVAAAVVLASANRCRRFNRCALCARESIAHARCGKMLSDQSTRARQECTQGNGAASD